MKMLTSREFLKMLRANAIRVATESDIDGELFAVEASNKVYCKR